MPKYKAIIVDDEESARNILYNLLQSYSDNIEIAALCEDVEDAVEAINRHNPDLVFLDIEMPNYSGLEIISFFNKINFEIIFVTAYHNYAVNAFEVSALDYLLKPIETARLETTIRHFLSKAEHRQNSINYQILIDNLSNKKVQKIIVNSNGAQKALAFADVVAIEASESYTKIIDIQGNRYTISKNLKHFETLLAENNEFFRVHKSWIVNYYHIINFTADYSIFLKNNVVAKLSKYRKSEFEEWMKSEPGKR